MLKLIIFSIYGHNRLSSRVLFNSIKSYLIFYMMLLPAFMSARDFKGASQEIIVLDDEFLDVPEYIVSCTGNIAPSRDLHGVYLSSK